MIDAMLNYGRVLIKRATIYIYKFKYIQEANMNEDNFNMEIRKFLKKVGITSQREIEKAVNDAISEGGLKGNETLKASMTLVIDDVNLSATIDGEISLE
jgi:hypothetical protein